MKTHHIDKVAAPMPFGNGGSSGTGFMSTCRNTLEMGHASQTAFASRCGHNMV
jgi:hypothetical protein